MSFNMEATLFEDCQCPHRIFCDWYFIARNIRLNQLVIFVLVEWLYRVLRVREFPSWLLGPETDLAFNVFRGVRPSRKKLGFTFRDFTTVLFHTQSIS